MEKSLYVALQNDAQRSVMEAPLTDKWRTAVKKFYSSLLNYILGKLTVSSLYCFCVKYLLVNYTCVKAGGTTLKKQKQHQGFFFWPIRGSCLLWISIFAPITDCA